MRFSLFFTTAHDDIPEGMNMEMQKIHYCHSCLMFANPKWWDAYAYLDHSHRSAVIPIHGTVKSSARWTSLANSRKSKVSNSIIAIPNLHCSFFQAIMWKSATGLILAILAALPSTANANGGHIFVRPRQCHLVFSRYEDPECGVRFGKDVVHPRVRKYGSPAHMGICQEWDGEPFQSYRYGWNQCAWYQQPWRQELGNCTMTVYEDAKCSEDGRQWVMANINSQSHVNPDYDSDCHNPSCAEQKYMRSFRYTCTTPGKVYGY
nr:hypothetical protein CFP56_30951 [Quercus suber]